MNLLIFGSSIAWGAWDEIMSKFLEKDYENLLIDGLHPNTNGHQIIFEEVKKYLLEKGYL